MPSAPRPRVEFYNSMNEARLLDARATVQAGLYINGLAATAILAFLGSVAPKIEMLHTVHSYAPRAFVWSLGCFGFGVFCAATAAALSYLTNHGYAEAETPFKASDTDRDKRFAEAVLAHTATYYACAGMLLAFLAGVMAAVIGFDKLG